MNFNPEELPEELEETWETLISVLDKRQKKILYKAIDDLDTLFQNISEEDQKLYTKIQGRFSVIQSEIYSSAIKICKTKITNLKTNLKTTLKLNETLTELNKVLLGKLAKGER